jgi:hypothetical protein
MPQELSVERRSKEVVIIRPDGDSFAPESGAVDTPYPNPILSMSMQVSTLKILESANFTMPQAMALAEAIEVEVKSSQFITIPLLDARVSELKLQIAQLETSMFNKMAALGLSGAGLVITAVYLMLNLKK